MFREKLRLVLPSSTFLFHRTCFTILPDPDSPDISSLWGFYYPGRRRPSPNGACTTFWPRRKTGFPSLKHFSLFFLNLSHPLQLLHQGTQQIAGDVLVAPSLLLVVFLSYFSLWICYETKIQKSQRAKLGNCLPSLLPYGAILHGRYWIQYSGSSQRQFKRFHATCSHCKRIENAL